VGRDAPGRAVSRGTSRGGSWQRAQARRAVALCTTSRREMRRRGGTSDSGNDSIVAIYWVEKVSDRLMPFGKSAVLGGGGSATAEL
jgi:hypothetical protein